MMTVPVALAGRCRIVETAAWLQEQLDLCGPAFLYIDPNGSGEGDQVQRTGWAVPRDDGSLEGEIAYDNGDETTFVAKQWPFSAAC